MAKITITIDGDNVTVNQSDVPTKVEQKNKKFFIIMREYKYNGTFWVEFVSDDYITSANKLICLRSNNDTDYSYRLLIQDENGTIMSCNGTDWDIDR